MCEGENFFASEEEIFPVIFPEIFPSKMLVYELSKEGLRRIMLEEVHLEKRAKHSQGDLQRKG